MAGCVEDGKCREHEHRISVLETQMREVKTMLRNPAVTVAVITVMGGVFTGFMAFLGVVLGPVVRAWLGV
jgi:hypothetical protein